KVKAGFKTFTYCGYWSKKSKSPNGSGTIWYRGDFVYQGDFVNGKKTGKGKKTWDNGDVYEGDFVNGNFTGKGKYTWGNGSVYEGDVYEGDFVNGNRTGKGKYTWDNGNVYEGDWVDGDQTGKGKFTWASGDVYEGDFVNDNRTGKGKLTWASGDVYEGDFVDGKIIGKEKNHGDDGELYEEDLVDGGFEGIVSSQTVTIGSQVWMTKNLNVDKFRNGDPIPQAKTDEEWENAGKNKQPAWCYYDNDPSNGAKYGKLYNWFAVNDPRGLAPSGYHVPSKSEWRKMENFLGSDVGKKMKSTSGWNSYTTGGYKTCPNCVNWNAEYRRKVPCHTCKDSRIVPAPIVTHSGNGTNSSGFSGLPGGQCNYIGDFEDVGYKGFWWSSTIVTGNWNEFFGLVKGPNIFVGPDMVVWDKASWGDGASVRCLRD
ncbi:hypothetical protein N8833_01325, partial [Salibacteraceae bacterium]|nr:hypothetical protein [Salibacteraceae bacterium]